MIRFTFHGFIAALLLAGMGTAQAADLIIDTPVEPGIVDVGSRWDGLYLGVFAGYGSGGYEQESGDTDDIDGWLIGGALGANMTLTDGIVVGLVGDLAWSDVGMADELGSGTIDWTGSLRGKLGFDGGDFMPYLTAGLAVAGTSIENDILDETDTGVHTGWTVGAGVEFAVAENLSIDALYRYSDYGDQTYDVGFGDFDIGVDTHQVSLGLNWQF